MEQFMVISTITVTKQKGSDSLLIASNIMNVPMVTNMDADIVDSVNPIGNANQNRSFHSFGTEDSDVPEGIWSMPIREYIQQNISGSDKVAEMIQDIVNDTTLMRNLEFAYTSVQELLDRHRRFPSVEQRIKLYMSNWYTPPCDDSARISYRFSNSSSKKGKMAFVSLKELTLQEQQDDVIENEKLNHREQRIFRVQTGSAESRGSFDEIHFVDRELFQSVKHMYHRDIVEFFLPSLDKLLNNKTGTNNTTPILYQFGDTRQPRAPMLHLENGRDQIFTQLVRNPRFPVIQKVRTSLSSNQLAAFTDRQDCYHRDERRGIVAGNPFNNAYNRVRLEPVILKLKTHRHYGSVYKIAEMDTIPWNEKKNMAIFRGALTGSYPDSMRVDKLQSLTAHERCHLLPRCWVTLKHASSELVDSKLTEPFVEGNDGSSNSTNPTDDKKIPRVVTLDDDDATSPKVELFGDRKTISEMLEYKAMILLEGNDISSGLKWALFSNSVILMPEPTLTSWAMEEMLQPWIHYVPIKLHKDHAGNGKTDVEEKMQWILDNEDKAQQIVRASTLWIADLVLHPDVTKDETAIFDEIARRYLTHFVPTSGQPI